VGEGVIVKKWKELAWERQSIKQLRDYIPLARWYAGESRGYILPQKWRSNPEENVRRLAHGMGCWKQRWVSRCHYRWAWGDDRTMSQGSLRPNHSHTLRFGEDPRLPDRHDIGKRDHAGYDAEDY